MPRAVRRWFVVRACLSICRNRRILAPNAFAANALGVGPAALSVIYRSARVLLEQSSDAGSLDAGHLYGCRAGCETDRDQTC